MSRFWTDQRLGVCVTSPDGGTTSVEVGLPFATVGADPRCDVVIDSAKLGGTALVVWIGADGIYARILSARSKKAGKLILLQDDKPIRLQEWSIAVEATAHGSQIGGVAEQEFANEMSSAPSSGDEVLALTWKEPSGRKFSQLHDGRMLLLGRKQPADLVFDDSRLSSVHCAAVSWGHTLWVFDLHSSNGTWSGKERRRCHEISIDKSVCLGGQRIHFARLLASSYAEQLKDEVASANSELVEAKSAFDTERADLLAALRTVEGFHTKRSNDYESKLLQQESLLSLHRDELDALQRSCQQFQIENSELASLLSEKEELLCAATDGESDLVQQLTETQSRNEQLDLRARDLEAQIANREMELSLREQELQRIADELAEQQLKAAEMHQKLELERGVLETLELELGPHPEAAGSASDEGHCVASPDFHSMLNEALEALPDFDEVMPKKSR